MRNNLNYDNQKQQMSSFSSLRKRVQINEQNDNEIKSRNENRKRCSSILTDGSIKSILSNGKKFPPPSRVFMGQDKQISFSNERMAIKK